jgi:molybdate transport system substrate-binding protein
MRLLAFFLILMPTVGRPAEAIVAVAANFAPALEALRVEFEATSPHVLKIASGSTGKLYAQIVNGAPFDLFLSADTERPRRLEASGKGVPGTRFTYATGRLVAWSAVPDLVDDDLAVMLGQRPVRRISIANPALAPYGVAARQVIDALGLAGALEGRIVMGENVVQAFTIAVTGNADVGIVALSTVLASGTRHGGTFVGIPASLHDPIRQDALLLTHGEANEAALAFVRFLQSDSARQQLASFGYGTD